MRNLYLTLLILCLHFSLSHAQLTMDNNSGDYMEFLPGDTWDITGDIKFEGKLNRYDNELLTHGIHFRNRITNTVSNNIVEGTSYNTNSVFGVHGDGTEMYYTGKWEQDDKSGFACISLMDTGKFILGASAVVDLINDSYFTRQYWIWSDGTGTFEFEEGFVSDLTEMGTVPEGLGSIRLSNCNVVTHNSESIPYGYRPNSSDGGPAINSHFVFENESGSKWIVKTNRQEFPGGIWMKIDTITIQTDKTLNITGEQANWPDYTNWGGVYTGNNCDGMKRIIFKTGQDSLILSGDMGFDPKSYLIVKEGTLMLNNDPYTNLDTTGYSSYYSCKITDANLNLIIEDSANLIVNTSLARIDSIGLSSTATLEVGLLDTLDTKKASFNGNLIVNIPEGISLEAGDTFNIIPAGISSGSFSNITLNDFGGQITWNTSKLYSEGKIYIESGSVISVHDDNIIMENITIGPNPFNHYITVTKKENTTCRINIFNLTGTMLQSDYLNGESTKLNYSYLTPGIYIFKIKDDNNNIIQNGKIIKK